MRGKVTREGDTLFRGPDSSELEADLAKIELCLRSLEADGALSPQERRLRSLYYTHLRNKVRSSLERAKGAHKETVGQLATGSAAPQRLRVEDTDHQAASINQVEPSDESWKVITPTGLIHAVTNIRKDFGELCDGQRHYFENKCFKDLHPLASGLTASAVFKKHFWDCVGALCKVVPFAFARLLDLSLNQNGMIGGAPVEWAALQMTDLIEREDRLVNGWIKSACDQRGDVEPATPEEFMEKVVFWSDWRAPKWLRMTPNGNSPYDTSTAWERMDQAETINALKALRENRWILSLESTLEDLVGSAHEVLAKRRNHPTSGSRQQPKDPVPAPAGKNNRRPRPKSDRLLSSYRSEIKRAILTQLALNPKATDVEICRGLDADGSVELPSTWRSKVSDRGFFDAYSDAVRRHKVEVTISKVRKDLRWQGLLD
jgi:hypothetical protein